MSHSRWQRGRLALLLGCRVANYGMAGYAVDQAVLRFEENATDESRVAILMIYPSNLLRNLTHQVGFVVVPSIHFEGLKPRFRLREDGTLELLPIPFNSAAELREYSRDPLAALADDWFLPTGYWARKHAVRFPYVRTVLGVLTSRSSARLLHRWRTGEPIEAEYYAPGHPSRSAELGAAIVERFLRTASQRGKQGLVVVLPDTEIMRYFDESGVWVHQPFIDALEARGAQVLSAGPALRTRLAGRPFAELMGSGHHYNPRGYRLLAESIHEALRSRPFGFLSQVDGTDAELSHGAARADSRTQDGKPHPERDDQERGE